MPPKLHKLPETKKMESVIYSELVEQDLESWLQMALKLWKEADAHELKAELTESLRATTQKTFIAKNQNKQPIGFINISIRYEYVEGASQSPTGYLEGIFVDENHRKLGVAKNLLKLGEKWLKDHNCKEIGSDTWLTNTESQHFHKKMGFGEAERLVHFLKKIEQ